MKLIMRISVLHGRINLSKLVRQLAEDIYFTLDPIRPIQFALSVQLDATVSVARQTLSALAHALRDVMVKVVPHLLLAQECASQDAMAVLAAQAMLVPACVLQAVTVQAAARQKSVMAFVLRDVIALLVLKRAVHALLASIKLIMVRCIANNALRDEHNRKLARISVLIAQRDVLQSTRVLCVAQWPSMAHLNRPTLMQRLWNQSGRRVLREIITYTPKSTFMFLFRCKVFCRHRYYSSRRKMQ